jgi:hypothetical protein
VTLAGATLGATLLCAPFERNGRWGERRPGVRCETTRAIVDFDPDGLDASERDAFSRLADRGVADLGRLLFKNPEPGAPVRFVVSARVSMSRTFGRTVLLPLVRVRAHEAPYLHEAVHALVPSRSRSTWLTEGLACYLESWVAEHVGGYDAHVFTRAGDRRIHDAARGFLKTDAGHEVLAFVGAPGDPPNLFLDRMGVARPFYVLAHSFTKYLIDRLGLPAVVTLAGGADPESALQKLTGRDAGSWRSEWLSGGSRPSARAPGD